MKLTDIVTADDVMKWLQAGLENSENASQFANEIFAQADRELFRLRDILASCGWEKAHAGAFLQFLDATIRHKTKEGR